MHPLIARFLDPVATRAVLERAAQGAALDPEEVALAAEAEKEPALARSLLKGARATSPEVQQRSVVLLVRAATARLLEDPALGPPARKALSALEAAGASAPEARALVAQAVLEEAFGYAEDPGTFDQAFLRETLEGLPALAAVDQAAIDGWLEQWARQGAAAGRPLRLKAAEALLEAAWGEGPQPLGPEHLDDALDHLRDTVAEADFQGAAEAVAGFLGVLAAEGLVGPLRLERLVRLTRAAAAAELGEEEEEPGDDEDAGVDEEED